MMKVNQLHKKKQHPRVEFLTEMKDGFELDESEPVPPAEKEDDKKTSSKHITHGYHLVQGKQGHAMEDYIVAKTKQVNDSELGLYAIFDGHSGQDVAKYLKNHLFDNILNEPDFWTNTKGAMKRAYKTTDNEILDRVVGSRGGSTAVTAILVDGEKLVVANVGDSRTVICNDGVAKQISVDHEPENEKETIESKGGFVLKKPGNVPRVDGQLAMARAFGDGRLKEHITSKPDVYIYKIRKDTEFIILASDGLWKVMFNQEAVDCIRAVEVEVEDGKEVAKCLVQEALDRGSTDDISCIVVIFQ